jgi:hypothetical protein
MRKAFVCMLTIAFLAGLAAPVLAQSTQTPSTTPAAPAAGGATTPAPKAAPAKPVKKVVAKHVTGTVKSAAADSLVLVTLNKDKTEKEWTFVLDKDTKIMKAGKPAEAKDLAEKDAATVSYKEADGKMHATSVTIKTAKKKA